MRNRLHLTSADWDKLKGFNASITRRILSTLPGDYYLTPEDVSWAVYDTIIHLLATYREGSQSPLSYVWQFAERYTRRDLLREYWRSAKYIHLDDLREDDDGTQERDYGRGDVSALTVDEREAQEIKDEMRLLLERATPEDRNIMMRIMQGDTQESIAADMGITQRAVSKRLKRYASKK